MLFLLACVSEEGPGAGGAVDPATVLAAAELGGVTVTREVVLDPGHFEGDSWVGDPLDAGVTVDGKAPVDGRLPLDLTWGVAAVAVTRPCGAVEVPARVGAAETISLPFPSCTAPLDVVRLPDGTRLDRWERSWGELDALAALGVVADVPPAPPGEAATPARYVDAATAAAVCAFWGGRLPTAEEWRTAGGGGPPTLDPAGPLALGDPGAAALLAASGAGDLDAGVSEWVADPGAAAPTVVGASWLRPAPPPAVPPVARTDELGFRCAFGPG